VQIQTQKFHHAVVLFHAIVLVNRRETTDGFRNGRDHGKGIRTLSTPPETELRGRKE
jgi:hypothetical protein